MTLPLQDRRSRIVAWFLVSVPASGCAIQAGVHKQKMMSMNGVSSSCSAEPFDFIERSPSDDRNEFSAQDLRTALGGQIIFEWTIECKNASNVVHCAIHYTVRNDSARAIYLLDVFRENSVADDSNIVVQFPLATDSVELIRGYVMPPAKMSWLTAPPARLVDIGQSLSGAATVADVQREWHYDRGTSIFRKTKRPSMIRLFVGYMLEQQIQPGEIAFNKVSRVYEIPRWRQSRSQQWLCSPLLNIPELGDP